jgi:hypothetical protein
MTSDRIGILLTQANMPLDLALEMVFRQQSQLFNENSSLKAQMNGLEEIMTEMAKSIAHLHSDVLELQGFIEGMKSHPVDRQGLDEADPEPRKVH